MTHSEQKLTRNTRQDGPGLCTRVPLTLFRIPHKPPAGSFRVLHAPARRGGIRRTSKTQRAGEGSGARQKPKTNLETDEFASNPPFSKKSSRRFHFARYFWRERWILKKLKTWNFKKSFKFRNSFEKTCSNNLVFEPMKLSPLPPP